MTATFDTCMSEGNANFASKDYEKAAEHFLAAVQELRATEWQSDDRWVHSRCALARAAFYAYGMGLLPKQFDDAFGNIATLLNLTWWDFHGHRSVAYLEVGHVYMEIADYLSQETEQNSENDNTARVLYGHAREMFQRLIISAEDELAHSLYRFHSYQAFPGVLDCLGRAREILERHAAEFRDPSEPPVKSPINARSKGADDSIPEMWRVLIESVAQRNGPASVELLDCAIAAARHLAHYDRTMSVMSILIDARDLAKANPAIDLDGRRLEYIGHLLNQI